MNAANRAALQEPSADGYINAIQIYPFSDGALYRLYAAPQEVSDIALQPGEALTAISAGDTTRWIVGDTTSGSGATSQVHILAKPFASGLKTNLVITTDRRSYHLELESTPHTFMAAVSWTYPQENLVAQTARRRPRLRHRPPTALPASKICISVMRSAATSPPGSPCAPLTMARMSISNFRRQSVKATRRRYSCPAQAVAMTLSTIGFAGTSTSSISFSTSAELRLGQDHQQVVRIKRTGMCARGCAPGTNTVTA